MYPLLPPRRDCCINLGPMDPTTSFTTTVHKQSYVVNCLLFGRPFVKRFALCYWTVVLSCLSVCLCCLSVCNVGVLWRNGWTNQDETWQAGRPRPRPHCVRWGPSSPRRGIPKFSAYVHCGQTAGLIKMPFGMEVGLGLATLC